MGPGGHAVAYIATKAQMLNLVITMKRSFVTGASPSLQKTDTSELLRILEKWDPRLRKLLSLTDCFLKSSILQMEELPSW